MARELKVVIVKPSKYGLDGYVERFWRGYMPNATIPFIASMTPPEIAGRRIRVHTVDEYVHGNLDYFRHLREGSKNPTLLALVGVQSHQFHRALDLAAVAVKHGCMAVIGGPHPMTCDTTLMQGKGVSFALAEAELVWPTILNDAMGGELQPVYGQEQRWATSLDSPILQPPDASELGRHIVPMLGVYPARGCPFLCNYCSVIKIAGRRVRSQSVETTMESLRLAKAAGVKLIMFTSDNFNKYKEATQLLEAMIEANLGLRFFCQCDTQIAGQPDLVRLMARAGCFMMFVGVESFNRAILVKAHKTQNRPEKYEAIVRLCSENGIGSHFSQIIGFPDDTKQGISEHVEIVSRLAPTVASFYTLTPIPGTEQYDDFMAQGLIYESNLDRFDGTCPTWHHPHMSSEDLKRMFEYCYREFYSLRHSVSKIRQNSWDSTWLTKAGAMLGYSVFARHCASQGVHPMSGGIWSVKVDKASDYLAERRERYGFFYAPLPASLRLSAAEEEANRMVNVNALAFTRPQGHPLVSAHP